jgi:alkyldihydroxyacetonephosphate synthase
VGEGAAEIADHLGFGSPELERPAALTIDHDRALHAHGASYVDVVTAMRGDFPNPPTEVLRPADEPALLAALERADAENLTVTPYGGGTSVVQGVEPIPHPRHNGAITLAMERFDRVLEVDPSRAPRASRPAPPVRRSNVSWPSTG